jgi:hypothetical protein
VPDLATIALAAAAPVRADSAQGVRSLVTYELCGRRYPLKTNPQCRICNSDERFEIERMLVMERSVRYITSSLPEDQGLRGRYASDDALRRAISRHRKQGHMPADVELALSIVDEEITALGLDPDDMQLSLVTSTAVLKELVRLGWERVRLGEIRVSQATMLRALTMLEERKEAETQVDQAMVRAAFTGMARVLTRILGPHPELLQACITGFEQDPDLMAQLMPGLRPQPAIVSAT